MSDSKLQYLQQSDSAVAKEILAHDWSKSPLGPIETWPASLTSLLTTMIACPAPMYLAWGPDLLSFYNDSYRPILGFRASKAMGQPFRELWAEIWDDIAPMVDRALSGASQSVTDMKLDLRRSGESEESYWSFSYSPAFDDSGAVAGMLCVTGETTGRVLAERERQASDERLQLALSAGHGIGVWDWDIVNDIVKADTRFAALYGVEAEKASHGAPISQFFGGIHPDDLLRVQSEIQQTIASGGSFTSEYRLLHTDGSVRWVSAQGRCVLDDQGRCVRFPGVSYDITERKQSELALRASKAEREFVTQLAVRQRELNDPAAVIQASAAALGKRLNANRVGFYRLMGSDRMHHGVGWSDGLLSQLYGEQSVSAFGTYAESERSKGRTLVFSDSRVEHDGSLAAYADEGVLSGLCVPLLDQGRWAAGIYLHHASVRNWTAAEISLVREVANLTWLAVERAEAMMRLQQRVTQQEAALSQAAGEIAVQTTSRLEAESEVRQLQKMDAVGQLAGGVAHDFNNMLAIVMGGLNLAQRRLARGDHNVEQYLEGAIEGAKRASTLTQRLLAFSRRQPLSPEPIDLNRLVTDLTELLTRSLGETVKLETVLGSGLWRTIADPNQLENVIINLAVNARDAMPNGGRLTIETANTYADEAYASEADITPGQYTMVAVTDTGTGMTPEVLAKAFDPFFTTKDVGKGTGLGLSQVYGYTRQSGGYVKGYSEVGHGTTIKVYLPRYWGKTEPAPTRTTSTVVRGGARTEIILVVEDEDRVRAFSVEALRELGYTAIHAASGPEALRILQQGQDISLLFTDVVMPDMTGRQLADQALKLRPGLKVIYTTGYTRNAVVHNGVLDPGTNFLAKPFTIDQLALKLRAVLDA